MNARRHGTRLGTGAIDADVKAFRAAVMSRLYPETLPRAWDALTDAQRSEWRRKYLSAGRNTSRERVPSDRELVEAVMRNASPKSSHTKTLRWFVVSNLFGVGEEVAKTLCARFAFDPYELI